MKYHVYGKTVVWVTVTLEADTEEDALDMAYLDFGGLTGYAGNGGSGKLVGTRESNVSLEPGDDVEFTEVEPA